MKKRTVVFTILVFLLLIVGCDNGVPTAVPAAPTATSIPPTAVPEPTSTTTQPTAAAIQAPVAIQVPLGIAATIDGAFSPGEWDGALTTDLANGGELMLMHNDGYLYLGIRSRAMGFGSICLADDDRVSILHSSAGLGTAVFERDSDDWRRTQQFDYCCWQAGQSRLNQFLQTEGWVASVGPKGVPEEMEYQIAMNDGSLTLAIVYIDDFSFETALHWPQDLDDDCLGLALIPEDPPERLSFSPETWVTITAVPAAAPAPTVPEETIIFTSARDGDHDIYLMNPDGGNLRQLTDDPGTEGYAAISPDGTRITYSSTSGGDSEVFIVDADGRNPQQITDNDVDDWWPSLSPDGTQIAFMSGSDGAFEIYIMNADGGDIRQLTNNQAENYRPGWSPNGDKIIFTSNQDGDFEIMIMDADGGNLRQLTDNSVHDIQPAWQTTVH